MQMQGVAVIASIPSGVPGVKETLKTMRRFVLEYRRNPEIISLAQSLTAHLPDKAWRDQVESLFIFVRDRIRYTLDTNNVEVLRTPTRLLYDGQGDCDDKATLLATLLESIGHPARFVAVGFSPGVLEHVLVETRIGNDWIPLDSTENVDVGWYPENVQHFYVCNI